MLEILYPAGASFEFLDRNVEHRRGLFSFLADKCVRERRIIVLGFHKPVLELKFDLREFRWSMKSNELNCRKRQAMTAILTYAWPRACSHALGH